MAELDAHRAEVLGHSARIIQRKALTYQSRKKFLVLQAASTEIQALCRGNTCCMRFLVQILCWLKKHVIRLSYSLVKLNLGLVARVCFETMRREAASLKIQKQARTYICQKAYKSLCSSACSVQTGMRAKAARVELHFRKKRRATIIIQASFYLAHILMKLFLLLSILYLSLLFEY